VIPNLDKNIEIDPILLFNTFWYQNFEYE